MALIYFSLIQQKRRQILLYDSLNFSKLFNQYLYIYYKRANNKKRMKIDYKGQIDSQQKIRELFHERNPSLITKLGSEVSPLFYQLHLSYQSGQSLVYRTHDEVTQFLEQCSKMNLQIENQFSVYKVDIIKNAQILKTIAKIENISDQEWFKKFFDIGPRIKGKNFSCQFKKQSGGRYSQFKCCLCLNWRNCKVYVLNDGVVTYNQSKNKIQQFMHFGKDFYWEVDPKQLNIVYIHSYHRKMSLQAINYDQFFIFLYNLEKFLQEYKNEQKEYRFNSYAPVRRGNIVQFYIDGADYFEALANGIQSATQEVFICGWWISPQFFLKRPCNGTNLDYRFDNLLARTAKKGVKIYIVIYYQSKFLTNDSTYTIKALQQLDRNNIKVLRHPQIVLPTFWSHHQKLIVIDQSFAFIGGLDICYGRYDTQEHLINNNDPTFYPGIEYNNCRIADFVQVSNYKKQNVGRDKPRLPWHDVALMIKGNCVKDLSRHFIQYWNYSSYQTHFADRYVLMTNGKSVVPKRKTNIIDGIKGIANKIQAKIHGNSSDRSNQPKQNQQNQQINFQQFSQQITEDRKVPTLPIRKTIGSIINKFLKKDKQNSIQQNQKKKKQQTKKNQKQSPSSELILNSAKAKELQNQPIDIDDIECIMKHRENRRSMNMNEGGIQNTQEQLFNDEDEIQFIEKRRIEKKQSILRDTFTQIQQITNKIEEKEHIEERAQGDYLQQKQRKIQPQQRARTSSLQIISKAKDNLANKLFGSKKKQQSETQFQVLQRKQSEMEDGYICQALRSASQWSIGSKTFQNSIHEAYLSMIEKAEKFIYIQNQFFISATHPDGVVKNRVMEALYKRIQRAVKDQQNFKVVIMMPLVPGFAGQLDDPAASLPRVIMNWQYKTICRGENSLLSRIQKITKTPQKYIRFFGLRTHGLIGNQPFTQIIYLHSKLMIIDDRFVICGSANINDRSMEGNRDSQLCVLVEGDLTKQIIIEKKIFLVAEKIHHLRTRLWSQHFGISQVEARNPIDPDIWNTICHNAQSNTQIYRKIFGCYPDDQIEQLLKISQFRKSQINRASYDQQYLKIKGNVVVFPIHFLKKEKLTSYHPNAIST